MLFEARCAGCDKVGAPLCRTCRFALLGPAPTSPTASLGGAEVPILAAVPFAGRAQAIIVGLKYRSRRAVVRHLAGVVVNRIVSAGDHHGLDLVTWAPTSPSRRRARGFDQSELIARSVARQLGVPCRRLLRRSGGAANSSPQTGRSRAERLEGGPEFVARPNLTGRTVLVIDDVVTTGATLSAAAAALAAAGVLDVRLAAVAATPPPKASVVLPLRSRRGPGDRVGGSPRAA